MPTTIFSVLLMAIYTLSGCGGLRTNHPETLEPWQHLESVGALDRPSTIRIPADQWRMHASCLLSGDVVLDQNTRAHIATAQNNSPDTPQHVTVTSDATFSFEACRGATATFSGQLKRLLFAPMGGQTSVFSDRLTGTLAVTTLDFHDPHCEVDVIGTQEKDGTFRYRGTLCGKPIEKPDPTSR